MSDEVAWSSAGAAGTRVVTLRCFSPATDILWTSLGLSSLPNSMIVLLSWPVPFSAHQVPSRVCCPQGSGRGTGSTAVRRKSGLDFVTSLWAGENKLFDMRVQQFWHRRP